MNRSLRLLLVLLLEACAASAPARLHGAEPVVTDAPGPRDFILIRNGAPAAPIYTDAYAAEPIRLAASDLAADIGHVSGAQAPAASSDADLLRDDVVIAGEIGRSRIIDNLAQSGAIDTRGLPGAWESWVIQVVDHPVPGVDRALVIAGSDVRGTVYGLYALSEALGVSPWAWWADVPIRKRASAAVLHGAWKVRSPAVKYRGLSLNTAAWSLNPWAAKTFEPAAKGAGPSTQAKVIELLLRLRGNCLWPPSDPDGLAFVRNADTVRLAISRGVVLGLPVDDPLPPDSGSVETTYLVGPHGPRGRQPVGGEAESERVRNQVSDQRTLLQAWISPDPARIPQAYCPWKEGLDVIGSASSLPRNVTLVWPDDGYGHLRRLAGPVPASRTGEAGILYHLAYIGAPSSYAWLSSTSPALMREELTRAWERGARRIWVAAVGGIKPNEIDTEFFLRLAWNPRLCTAAGINEALTQQLARDFGPGEAGGIAALLDRYYQLNFQRRPEHVGLCPAGGDAASQLYSPSDNGDEIRQRLDAWGDLAAQAAALRDRLDPDERTAYRELVLQPIECSALANIRGLNVTLCFAYRGQGRASVPLFLQRVRDADGLIHREVDQYSHLAHGKWRGFMAATPPGGFLWPISKIQVPARPPAGALLGLAPEGGTACRAGPGSALSLPEFAGPCPTVHFFDVFTQGSFPVRWTARASVPWIHLDHDRGRGDDRVRVGIDWHQVPEGEESLGSVEVAGGGAFASVSVRAWNPAPRSLKNADFAEVGGRVSIDPALPSRLVSHGMDGWTVLPGLGYRGSVIQATNLPEEEEAPIRFASGAARLDFRVWLRNAGVWTVVVRTLPAWPDRPGLPLRYAVAVDGEPPQVVPLPAYAGESDPAWREDVLRNAAVTVSGHAVAKPGLHTVKIWRVDEGIAFDSILLENRPESPRGYTWPAETRILR